MNCIYRVAVSLLYNLIRMISVLRITSLMPADSKRRKFIDGQRTALSDVIKGGGSRPANVVWVHASSLGEYGVARPLIKELKERYGYHTVITFFSPTGYEALKTMSDRYPEADEVYYLPLDTAQNARLMVESIRPERAVFIISEIWINYLDQLRRHNVPTFLVSAKITRHTSAAKWYGRPLRDALFCFNEIMVLDYTSERILHRLGVHNVRRTGDPLFDNAIAVARADYSDEVLDRFCSSGRVFIAGSISDDNDLKLVSHLANKYATQKFIFVPHEVSEAALQAISSKLSVKCVRYSELQNGAGIADAQVLLIDFIGALAHMYRYCTYAYVGGGFTPYLHSVIEATVYGLPVAFGPEIYRKNTPQELIDLGIGAMVRTPEEIDGWFRRLKDNTSLLAEIRIKAKRYTESQTGATGQVIEIIADK